MNKELEEAIKRLNNFSKIKIMYGNIYAIHLEDLKEIQQAIETVLNYIDNSISKEVIEEKIEERKIDMALSDISYKEDYVMQVLQELLEEK